MKEDKAVDPEDVGFLGTGREVAAPADEAHLVEKAGLRVGGRLMGKSSCGERPQVRRMKS